MADATVVIGGDDSGAQRALNNTQQALNSLVAPAGNAAGAIGGLVSQMGSFINGALQMATGIGLYNLFDTLTSKAREFGMEMFNLNNTMEKTQVSWEYLFGTGSNASSQKMAQGLADWTKKYSYDVPFTRQDLLASIGAMGMATQDPEKIKQWEPLIADIASVRTNSAGQNVTLQQAAFSLAMANEGMSRMLKYDLKITPDDLKKYGWNEKAHDINNLMDALKKYEDARHLTGAAHTMATTTWFGEWSSFIDRIQNFQLEAGQSMFGVLKKDLNDFTDWWDSHQSQLNAFADTMGKTVAGAFTTLGNAAKDFIHGWAGGPNLSKLGVLGEVGAALHGVGNDVGSFFGAFFAHGAVSSSTIIEPLRKLAEMLSSSGVQAGFAALGRLFGDLQSTVVTGVFKAASSFIDGFGSSGAGAALLSLVNALDGLVATAGPFVAQMLQFEAGFAGSTLGTVLALVATGITDIVNGAKDFMKSDIGKTLMKDLSDGFKNLGDAWKHLTDAIGPDGMNLLGEGLKALGVVLIGLPLVTMIAVVDTLTFAFNALAIALKAVKEGLGWFGGLLSQTSIGLHNLNDWLNSAFLALVQWPPVMQLLNSLIQAAQGVWSAFTDDVRWAGQALWGAVQQSWAFQGAMAAVQIAVQQVGTALQNVQQWPAQLVIALAKITATFQDWATKLEGQFLQWGVHFIQNLIDGIKSKLDDLATTASAAGWILKKFLGHSVPSAGPLTDELEWMPHMMQNLARTMEASMPILGASAARTAQTLRDPFQGGWGVGNGGGPGGGGGNVSYGNASTSIAINAYTTAEITAIVNSVLAAQDAYSRGAVSAPGGYRVFGALGGYTG